MMARLEAHQEVVRACSRHYSYPVHEQKWWGVVHYLKSIIILHCVFSFQEMGNRREAQRTTAQRSLTVIIR